MKAAEILNNVKPTWLPPPDLTGSEWADKHRVVASGPFPGPWRTSRTPYLKEPLDCVTDPEVEKIIIIKPTRMGATEGVINNAIGYFMHYEPCNMMYVNTSDTEVKKYSKEILDPMIEVTPLLRGLVDGTTGRRIGRKADQTILSKTFKGGNLTLVGGVSPKGFRMVSKRIVILDDIDGYERNIEGDVVKLAEGRTKDYWNRKIIMASSPTTKYVSRIADAFEDSDQRYRYVPCPHCDEFQVLKFGGKDFDYGIKWNNTDVWYMCKKCHERIFDYQKYDMDLKGVYRPEKEFLGTAGFHINPFLCTWHPWLNFKKEFLESKTDPFKLMVFVNQYLGEVWEDKQDERVTEKELYDRSRADIYDAEAPTGVYVITAAIDVQARHIEIEVKGWGVGEESWTLEYKIINGRFLEEKTQQALDTFLSKTFKNAKGFNMPIQYSAIDLGGHYSSQVYEYCRSREVLNIYAVKGSTEASADVLDGPLKEKGKNKHQMVGVSACKEILYGRLKIKKSGAGYMHFPMSLDKEYFNGLMAEVPVATKTKKRKWEVIPGRKNEPVDLHSYNLAALRMYNPDWELLQKQDYLEDKSKLVFLNHTPANRNEDIVIDEKKPLVLCCSFNTNPMVWLVAQAVDNRVNIIDEIVLRNGNTTQMCAEIVNKYGGHKAGILVYGSAVGNVRTSAPKSDYMIMKEYGFTRQKKPFKNPLEQDVINSINNMLSNQQGVQKLYYHPRCILLDKDFKYIAYTDNGELDKIDYGRGIAIESLGFYIHSEWPLKIKKVSKRFYK